MSREGFPAAIEEQSVVDEAVINPAHAGAEWLAEQGVNYEVAAMQLVGPLKECNGSLAEMVGIPGHSEMRDNIKRTIDTARSEGKDPGEALTQSLEIMAKRDETGEIMRVPIENLKKK